MCVWIFVSKENRSWFVLYRVSCLSGNTRERVEGKERIARTWPARQQRRHVTSRCQGLFPPLPPSREKPWERGWTGNESGIKIALVHWLDFQADVQTTFTKCFTVSRWRSFTFSVASDGPHFLPIMSPCSIVHPLTTWGWHRTLTS